MPLLVGRTSNRKGRVVETLIEVPAKGKTRIKAPVSIRQLTHVLARGGLAGANYDIEGEWLLIARKHWQTAADAVLDQIGGPVRVRVWCSEGICYAACQEARADTVNLCTCVCGGLYHSTVVAGPNIRSVSTGTGAGDVALRSGWAEAFWPVVPRLSQTFEAPIPANTPRRVSEVAGEPGRPQP